MTCRNKLLKVETSANHPEQMRRNYEKNVRQGRFVVFVVSDDGAENRVKDSLKNVGKKYRIFEISVN